MTGTYAIPSSSLKKMKCPDVTSVSSQCTVPTGPAGQTICDADPNCGGITCNTARSDCPLRYYPLTAIDYTWRSHNTYVKTVASAPQENADSTALTIIITANQPPFSSSTKLSASLGIFIGIVGVICALF